MSIIDWFMPAVSEDGCINFYEPLLKKRLYISTRPYVIRKTQGNGEKDLEKLVMKEAREGCWAYSHDNSAWYSIAAEYIKGRESLNVLSYDLNFAEMGSIFTHYHTHTKKSEAKVIDDKIREIDPKKRLDKGQILKLCQHCSKILAVLSSLPSDMDIHAYYYIAQRNPACEIDFKIATPYCITSVQLLDKSLDPETIAKDYDEVYSQTLSYGQMGAYTGMADIDAIESAFESVNVCFKGMIELSLENYKK